MAHDDPHASTGYDVVAIGASAGGIHALGVVLTGLPADLPVPVLIVQHLDPHHRTLVVEVLRHHSALPLRLASDGDTAVAGTCYIAPPDHHLLVGEGHRLHLSETERVHFVRPSVDVLFASVAATYGERAIAVVLTGAGSDGAMGVRSVKSGGGTVIVEDPATAEFPSMPHAACAAASVDFVVPLAEVAGVVVRLVTPGAREDA